MAANKMTPDVAQRFMDDNGIAGEPLVCSACDEVLDIMGLLLPPEITAKILREHREKKHPTIQ